MPPNCVDRHCVGRRRTGTRHGNVCHSVREKQGIVVYRLHVLQTVTSLRVVSLVFRGHDLLKIANINPQQKATLSVWKRLVPHESDGNGAKVLVNTLKAVRLMCVRSHSSREIRNATISEFSTFLKINKSREQFLLRLTLFYPIYG